MLCYFGLTETLKSPLFTFECAACLVHDGLHLGLRLLDPDPGLLVLVLDGLAAGAPHHHECGSGLLELVLLILLHLPLHVALPSCLPLLHFCELRPQVVDGRPMTCPGATPSRPIRCQRHRCSRAV